MVCAILFRHEANRRAIRSTFCEDTTIKVYEDVGDFIVDEDLTPFETVFYRGAYGKEIFGERWFCLTRNEISRETKVTFLRI